MQLVDGVYDINGELNPPSRSILELGAGIRANWMIDLIFVVVVVVVASSVVVLPLVVLVAACMRLVSCE